MPSEKRDLELKRVKNFERMCFNFQGRNYRCWGNSLGLRSLFTRGDMFQPPALSAYGLDKHPRMLAIQYSNKLHSRVYILKADEIKPIFPGHCGLNSGTDRAFVIFGRLIFSAAGLPAVVRCCCGLLTDTLQCDVTSPKLGE